MAQPAEYELEYVNFSEEDEEYLCLPLHESTGLEESYICLPSHGSKEQEDEEMDEEQQVLCEGSFVYGLCSCSVVFCGLYTHHGFLIFSVFNLVKDVPSSLFMSWFCCRIVHTYALKLINLRSLGCSFAHSRPFLSLSGCLFMVAGPLCCPVARGVAECWRGKCDAPTTTTTHPLLHISSVHFKNAIEIWHSLINFHWNLLF